MNISTDCAFKIGHTHKVCEDYACCNNKCIVLSDGCSTAPNTDIGARILAHSTMSLLSQYDIKNIQDIVLGVGRCASLIARNLSLFQASLSATLLTAHINDGHVLLNRLGDGCLIWKYKNQSINIDSISFNNGAPYYLKYELNGDHKDKYIYLDKFGVNGKVLFTRSVWDLETDVICENMYSLDIHNILRDMPHYSLPLENLEFVALMSDGIFQVNHQEHHVSEYNIASELLDFKTLTGQFVKRRFNKVFKAFAKREWKCLDDISLAVMAFHD